MTQESLTVNTVFDDVSTLEALIKSLLVLSDVFCRQMSGEQ